jgi:Protein of unknown function with PCYCGC motif
MRATIACALLGVCLAAGCAPGQEPSATQAPASRTAAAPAEAPPPASPATSAAPAGAADPARTYRAEPLPKLPNPERLPPIPELGFAPPRPFEEVRAVYRFAALHPEVMRYVPCFCGCERNGHQDNEDCFVKARAADGSVTWEPHGLG